MHEAHLFNHVKQTKQMETEAARQSILQHQIDVENMRREVERRDRVGNHVTNLGPEETPYGVHTE